MCKGGRGAPPPMMPQAPAPAAPAPQAPVPTNAPAPEGREVSEEARAEAARKRGRGALRIDPNGVGGLGGGSGVNTPRG